MQSIGLSKVSILYFVTAMVASMSLASTVGAVADPTQKLLVSAAAQNVTLDPGANYTHSLTLANQGNEPFVVSTSVSPYGVDTLEYTPQFKPLPGAKDVTQWVTVAGLSNEIVEPLQVRDFTYTVSVPVDTAPGGYYAVLFVTSEPMNKRGVTVNNRVGVVLYITVNGVVKKQGDITGQPAPPLSFGGPVDVSTIVSNSGGVHFMPAVKTVVYDIFGREVWNMSQQKYVLPGTERRFTAEWQPTGLFGVYKLQRSAVLFDATKNVADSWFMYVHPLFLLAGLVGCGVAAGIITRSVKKRRPHA